MEEDIDKIPLVNQVNKATDATAHTVADVPGKTAESAAKTTEKAIEGEGLKPTKIESNDAAVQQAHELADDVAALHKDLKGFVAELVDEIKGAVKDSIQLSIPMSTPSSSSADPTSELQALDMAALPTEGGSGKQMGAQVGEQAGQALGASVAGPSGAAVGGKIGKKVGAEVGEELEEGIQGFSLGK